MCVGEWVGGWMILFLLFVFLPDLKVLRIEDDLSSDLRIDEEFIVLSSFGNSENIRENISSCIPNIFSTDFR